jgi:dTDP-4-amino-4,6-dideoxygalactose transaminase
MKAYRDQISLYPELGNTSIVSSEIMLFPTGQQVTEDDIKRFADILNDFLLAKSKPK